MPESDPARSVQHQFMLFVSQLLKLPKLKTDSVLGGGTESSPQRT